jgi:hypothetical protein
MGCDIGTTKVGAIPCVGNVSLAEGVLWSAALGTPPVTAASEPQPAAVPATRTVNAVAMQDRPTNRQVFHACAIHASRKRAGLQQNEARILS